jgi:hypothetical protein
MMFVLTGKSKIPGRRSGVCRCVAVNTGKSNTCLHDERVFCRTFACLLDQDFRILRFARLIVLISKDLKRKFPANSIPLIKKQQRKRMPERRQHHGRKTE